MPSALPAHPQSAYGLLLLSQVPESGTSTTSGGGGEGVGVPHGRPVSVPGSTDARLLGTGPHCAQASSLTMSVYFSRNPQLQGTSSTAGNAQLSSTGIVGTVRSKVEQSGSRFLQFARSSSVIVPSVRMTSA